MCVCVCQCASVSVCACVCVCARARSCVYVCVCWGGGGGNLFPPRELCELSIQAQSWHWLQARFSGAIVNSSLPPLLKFVAVDKRGRYGVGGGGGGQWRRHAQRAEAEDKRCQRRRATVTWSMTGQRWRSGWPIALLLNPPPPLLRKLCHGECQCVCARQLCGGNVHVDNEDSARPQHQDTAPARLGDTQRVAALSAGHTQHDSQRIVSDRRNCWWRHSGTLTIRRQARPTQPARYAGRVGGGGASRADRRGGGGIAGQTEGGGGGDSRADRRGGGASRADRRGGGGLAGQTEGGGRASRVDRKGG